MMYALKVLIVPNCCLYLDYFSNMFCPKSSHFTAKEWITSPQAFFRCVHSGSANVTVTFLVRAGALRMWGTIKELERPLLSVFLQDEVTVKMKLRTAAALILALSGILNS